MANSSKAVKEILQILSWFAASPNGRLNNGAVESRFGLGVLFELARGDFIEWDGLYSNLTAHGRDALRDMQQGIAI